MESVWLVSKFSTESVGSRRELVANCVHTADATKQFRRVGVGGVYWALALVVPCRKAPMRIFVRLNGSRNKQNTEEKRRNLTRT